MIRRRRTKISLKPFFTILLVGSVVFFLTWIAPSSLFLAFGFVLLLGTTAFHVSTYFTNNIVTQILIPLFIVLFLTTNLFAGFNVLNTILLLSFIIGVRLLFR